MSKAQTQRSQFIMLFFAFSFGMILSNLLGQTNQTEPTETSEVVMVYRGIDKSIDDLPEPIASEFKELRENALKKQTEMLYSVALQWQLEEFAAKQQLSLEEAGNRLFDLSPPTEAEVNTFYVSRADDIGKPFFEVKESIHQHLVKEKALQARYNKIAELLETGDLALQVN